MESFGRYIRAEREARDVSLEELAAVTKINRRTLQALEADNFEELPPPVFVRGFVRTICRTLNLPTEEFVQRFDDFVATHGPEAPSEKSLVGESDATAPVRPQPAGGAGSGLGLLLLVGALILVGVGVFLAYRFGVEEGGQPVPPLTEQSDGTDTGEAASTGAGAPGEVAAIEPEAVPDGEAAEAPVPIPEEPAPAAPISSPESTRPAATATDQAQEGPEQTVVLESRGLCWVRIIPNGEEPREYTLREGERLRLTYHDRLELRVGDPGLLAIETGGTRYERAGPSGRPRTYTFPLDAATKRRLERLSRKSLPSPAAAQSSQGAGAPTTPSAEGGPGESPLEPIAPEESTQPPVGQ